MLPFISNFQTLSLVHLNIRLKEAYLGLTLSFNEGDVGIGLVLDQNKVKLILLTGNSLQYILILISLLICVLLVAAVQDGLCCEL